MKTFKQSYINNKTWYFAYGSNMSDERFKEDRNIKYDIKQVATLKDWKVVFNKISAPNPLIAVANIEKKNGDYVKGIAYQIDVEYLDEIDKYERAPEHYERIEIKIELEDGTKSDAITYKARNNHTFKNDEISPVNNTYFNWMTKAEKDLGVDYMNKIRPNHILNNN